MAALLKEESTITAKGQTTVPKAVRQALERFPGDLSRMGIHMGWLI